MTTTITRQAVLNNLDIFLDAIHLFRATATDLMGLLAQHLNVPLSAFADRYFRFQLDFSRYDGSLIDGWSYWFHGFECQFTHGPTGQTFDVKLGYQHEFGVLDPHFFWRFVTTTPGLTSVTLLVQNGYSEVVQVFAILLEEGYLRRIPNSIGDRSGLVTANP